MICLDALAAEMTRSDPAVRLPLESAQRVMNTTFLGLSGWRYRWPIVPSEAGFKVRSIYMIWGVVSEVEFWLSKVLRLIFRGQL
jgi:hypothetical protein